MNLSTLLKQTFKHYLGNNLATSAGIAITTAIICGSLIIGDSLNNSLVQIVDYRLGKTTHTITSGDRIFTQGLAKRLNEQAAPVLKTEAIASIQGGVLRVNKVQVWGIDSTFSILQETGFPACISEDEAIISLNLSKQLNLKVGDSFLIRVKKTGPIPGNTPFVSENDQTVSRSVTVKSIVGKEQSGQFNLQISQTAPFNIFVNIGWLNQLMSLHGKANLVLLKTDKNIETLQQEVRKAFSLGDANLLISQNSVNGSSMITSERVFIDDFAASSIKAKIPETSAVLTYFVNKLSLGSKETPYSFVSAVDKQDLKSNEILINDWLAQDLGAKTGDSLKIKYFVFGPLRKLVEKEAWLKVKGIISMEAAQKDRILMPHLPGLSDAGNCRDWKAGIPIDLKRIRPKDEAYWKAFGGTPKAYVSLAFGQQLWENQYGSYTALIVPGNSKLSSVAIDPFKLQFQVNEVRKNGLDSAKSGVDFGQLFAGLGIFILASGLLLTILLFSLSLKRRENQIKLFTSIGFPTKLIRRIYLTEIFGISLVGATAGLIITIGYCKLILLALNKLWNDIVRTDVLVLKFDVGTLATGFVISLLLGILVVYFGTNKALSRINKTDKALRPVADRPDKRLKYLTYSLFSAFIVLEALPLFHLIAENIFLGFLAGTLLLLALLLGTYDLLHHAGKQTSKGMGIKELGWKNLTRNPARSFTIFSLLALGSFVIVVTALNRKESIDNTKDLTNGTGGFEFLAESTVPILRDLNDPTTKTGFGLPDSLHFVQFYAAYNDQASCLNLNRIANPRILATNPALLDGRFSFAEKHSTMNPEHPWNTLNRFYKDVVPAIADQSVIQWGLGKKIGDTLQYTDNKGQMVRLLLVGGLSNSIFQGNVLISAENFAKHFSVENGSSFVLIDCPEKVQPTLPEELEMIFRDKGWVMQGTRQKLDEFNSIENTYLSIFFLMGAFGMLLGIIGLSIFISRNLLERKNELSLFKSLGFSNKTILQILLNEYISLFLAGTLSGTLAAFIAALPTLLTGNQTVPTGFLITVLGFLVLNGIAWICLVSIRIIRKSGNPNDYRND